SSRIGSPRNMAEYDLDDRQREKLRELVELTRGVEDPVLHPLFSSEAPHRWKAVFSGKPDREIVLNNRDVATFQEQGLIRSIGPNVPGGTARIIPTGDAERAVANGFQKPDEPQQGIGHVVNVTTHSGHVQFAIGNANQLAQDMSAG